MESNFSNIEPLLSLNDYNLLTTIGRNSIVINEKIKKIFMKYKMHVVIYLKSKN